MEEGKNAMATLSCHCECSEAISPDRGPLIPNPRPTDNREPATDSQSSIADHPSSIQRQPVPFHNPTAPTLLLGSPAKD